MENKSEIYKGPLRVEVESQCRYDQITGEKKERNIHYVRRTDNNYSVACFSEEYEITPGEAAYRANLFAAAPMLYEALEKIAMPFDCINCEMSGAYENKICADHLNEVIEIARDAIAKARGEG